MNIFEGVEFWMTVAIVAAAAHLLPDQAHKWRAALLAVASIAGLVLVVDLNPLLLAVVAGSIGWIWIASRAPPAWTKGRTTLATTCGVGPVLAVWVVGKQSVGAGFDPLSFLYFIGFSFFLIKAWTFLKDLYDGRTEQPDIVVLCAYFLHFPTYVSGPMHYMAEFRESLRKPERLDLESAVDVGFRIALGLLKIKFLAPLLTPLSLLAIGEEADVGVSYLVIASVCYSLVLLFDFSGYADLAIATSRLVGIRTPENFNWPYLAPNIREFWQRWHMSFTRALTSYVFIPLSRSRWLSPLGTGRTRSATCYLLTFAACGYWHGATVNFILWGLYHAIGLIFYDIWRSRQGPRRRGSQLEMTPTGLMKQGAATALTFAFVSAGWILFVFPIAQITGWANHVFE